MIVENVDALKAWLIKTLEPICDADPDPLAKYVVALLKKEKTEKELKVICQDQLDVFLQSKTKDFVEKFFDVLISKAYLPPAGASTTSSSKTTTSKSSVVPDSTTPVSAAASSSSSSTSSQNKTDRDRKDSDSKKKDESADKPKDLREKLADKDNKDKAAGDKETKDLREKLGGDRDRDFRRRLSRSLSPRRRDIDDRRRRGPRGPYYRRRTRSRSPRRFSRSPVRSRSPFRRRYRSRSPRARSWSRSRSRSPWSFSRSRSPRSWSKSRSRSRSRGRRPQPDSRGSTPTLDNGKYTIPSVSGVYANVQEDKRYLVDTSRPDLRRRCADYDEKGFCLLGDLCPYDHGTDPVIVEDVGIPPTVMPFPPGPPTSGPGIPPGPGHGPGPGFMGHRPRMPGPPGPPGPHPPMSRLGPHPPRPDRFEGYNPEAPAISRPPPMPPHGPPPPFWPRPGGPPPRLPPGPPPGFPPQQGQLPPRQARDHLVNIQTLPDSSEEESSIAPPGTELPPEPSAPSTERTVIAPKRPYSAISEESEAPKPPQGNGLFSQNRPRYGHPLNKKPFDYNRIGGYRAPTASDMENTTLQCIKIPKDFLTIAKINEHFGKFGNLVNIKIGYDNSPDTVLVSYSSNSEALAAFRSPEPVFNNRFIKLFWHKPQNKDSQQGTDNTSNNADTRNVQAKSVKSRLGAIPHISKLSLNNTIPKPNTETPSAQPAAQLHPQQPAEKSMVYSSSVGNITKTVYNPEALKAKAALSSPTAVQTASFVSKIEAIKRQEQIKKEAMQKKVEIQKQKQQLLTKQLEQQKVLIQKLEKSKNMSAEDKDMITKTVKMLETSIIKLKAELLPRKLSAEINVKSPEQARKEILDTELELMTKSHSGADTTQLKLKLNELTRQANALGLLGRGRGRGRGRGSTTWVAGGVGGGGGRGGMSWSRGRGFHAGGSRSLDKRPKQLQVSGFDAEDKDGIQPHFVQHGQVDKIEFESDGLTAIVDFKTRKDAEQAVLFGAKYKDKVLAMKWYIPIKVPVSLSASSDDNFSGEGAVEDEVAVPEDEFDEDALLAGDDDEEDDEESRSWRR